MSGSKPGARSVRSASPGVRNGTEKFPSASVLRSRCSRVASLSMTTAAPATGAPRGSLTLPAIAPVLAVWACISRGQNAKTEILNKMQVACIEMLHITPLVQRWFGALSLLQVVVNHAAMTSIDRGKLQLFVHSAQFNGGSSVHLSHDTPAMHGNSDFAHTEH